MNSNDIMVTGLVATTPRHVVTSDGLPITSFRLASSLRKFNDTTNKWEEVSTNWYTVTCFRRLAENAIQSIEKGQRVIVVGGLSIREWTSGGTTGTSVELRATTLSHDLMYGTSQFTRNATLDLTN